MGRSSLGLVSCIIFLVTMCLLSLLPAAERAAAATCPRTPTTLAKLIAVEDGADHPLSDRYRRSVWPYTERAAACFGGTEFSLVVFVGGPEGIGGVSAFTVEPRWILAERFVAIDASTTDPSVGNAFFPVAVPPALEARFTALDGRWVRIRGHFDDDRAGDCRVVSGEPPDAPPPEVVVEICRTAFVLTSIRGVSDTPGTDMVSPLATDGGRAAALWVPMSLALVFAGTFVLALRLDRRTR